MKHEVLKVGTVFENDTYYTANEDLFFALGDATPATKPEYLSVSPNNLDKIDTCILLQDKKNIVLDFAGNTLLMQGRVQPIIIDNCENITIKNCVAEFENTFSMQFEIMEIGDGYVMLKPNSRQNCKIVDGCIVSYGKGWENDGLSNRFNFLACFDKQGNPRGQILVVVSHHPNYDKNAPFLPIEYTAEQVGDYIRFNGPVNENWRVGDYLVEESEPRYRSGINMQNSRNITIENHRIVNGVGVGLCIIHCHNISIDRFNMIYDSRSHGIVANSADAIHSFACSGYMKIKNSKIENIIDDFINVHGNYLTVSRVINEKTVECKTECLGLNIYCNFLDVGDEVAFYKGKTMAVRESNVIKEKKILDKKTVVFTLEQPIGNLCPGDILENVTGNAELYVNDCEFLNANSHIRLQTRGKTVFDNCTFDIPICLTGDSNVWFEGNRCLDLTIQNSRFTTPRAFVEIVPEFEVDDDAPFYHENIKLLNNTFLSDVAIRGHNARNIQVFGNRNVQGKTLKLELKDCEEIATDNAELIKGE